MTGFGLELLHLDEVLERFEGPGVDKAVTRGLHASADDVRGQIDPLIPVSGRRFKRHRSGARGSRWQKYDKSDPTALVVGTVPSRRYLYFPDDGVDTYKHAGNLRFFERGGALALPRVTQTITEAIVEELGFS